MFDFIATLLAWFYELVNSYAGAVVLLTLAVMVTLTPLTLKGTKSMLKMQEMQPELKRLQDKHKDDREALNQEMMAFYKENDINPVSGCLPTLIQIPVFIVLFQVIRGLTNRLGGWSSQSGYALVGETTEFDPNFDPRYIDESTQLYQDLSSTNEMQSWGIDLAISPSDALSDGIATGLPYLFLIAVVAVTSWLQQRQIQARATPGAQNPQQQAIMRFLPFMLPVIAFTMPAALVLYFVFSNLYRLGQQAYITRRLYGDRVAANKASTTKAKATKGGKSQGGKSQGGKAKATKGGKSQGGKSQGGKAKATKGGKSQSSKSKSEPSKNGGEKSAAQQKSNGRGARDRSSAASKADPVAPRPRKKKRKRN